MEPTLDDLLTADERRDLARVIGMLGDRNPAAADAADLRRRLEDIYLDARLAGLCREGALELVTAALHRWSGLPRSGGEPPVEERSHRRARASPDAVRRQASG